MPQWLEQDVFKYRTHFVGTSPLARGPEHEDWPLRLERATRHARTCVANAPGDGGRALFEACQWLVRTYELPLDVARDLLVQEFNPRCMTVEGDPYPWDDCDIIRKLEQARDVGTFQVGSGLVLENAQEMAREILIEAQRPTVAPVAAGERRRFKDPNHRYTYTVGDRANGKKVVRRTDEVVADLCTHEAWAGVLQYDEFSDKVRAVDPPVKLDAERDTLSDSDAGAISEWFAVCSEYKVSELTAWKAAIRAARRHAYHPVREYLDSLPVADTSILDGLAARLFGSTEALDDDMLRKFLISAVRRTYKPGDKVDTILVLQGPQAFKKSTFALELFGREFTVEDLIADLKSNQTDALQALQGAWCIELAEVDKLMHATSSLKAFLSRCQDRFRCSYARATLDKPRGCVFIGTTNVDHILQDATGDRRYWVIKVQKKIDIAWIRANRNAIWAAARALAEQGEPHWYEDEEEVAVHREQFVEVDSWHGTIQAYVEGKERTTAIEVWSNALMGEVKDLNQRQQKRIADTLRRCGFETKLIKEGGKVRRFWARQ